MFSPSVCWDWSVSCESSLPLQEILRSSIFQSVSVCRVFTHAVRIIFAGDFVFSLCPVFRFTVFLFFFAAIGLYPQVNKLHLLFFFVLPPPPPGHLTAASRLILPIFTWSVKT